MRGTRKDASREQPEVKQRMKRTILLVAILAICLPLAAQRGPRLTATIPFAFEMSDGVMPAGEYMITHSAVMPGFVMIEDVDQKHSAYVLTSLASPGTPAIGETYLTFSRYEDRHFLAKVVFLDHNCEVVKSKSEKVLVTSRILKASAPATEVKIMAAAR